MWDEHVGGGEIGLIKGRGIYDPARPSLLLVHGSGGRGEGFLPQLSLLAKEINVAAIDLPGHGGTPGPGLDTVQDYAAWLGDFLEAGPVRPVVLGHSLGGAVALTLALSRPHLIHGLILAGSGSRLKVLPAILEGLARDFSATVGMIVGYAYAEGADPRFIAQGVENMRQVLPQVLIGDFTACNGYDVSGRLGEVRHPTLVMVGSQDRLTPVKYSQAMAQAIPGARLVIIEGAGHMAFLEKHIAFNEAVLDFMAAR